MSNQWDPTAPQSDGGDDAETRAVSWGSPGGSSAVPPTAPYGQPAGTDPWGQGTNPGPAPAGIGSSQSQYGQPQYGQAGQPQYGQQQYGAPGQQPPSYAAPGAYPGAYQPYYAAATRDTSGALTLLIVGCVGAAICGVLPGLPGIICGAMAMGGNRTQEDIDRLVKTGWTWTGVLAGLSILLLVAYFVFVFAVLTSAGSTGALGAM